MKEIGSEFWEVPVKKTKNQLFPDTVQWYISGRSALKAIINELSDCHSVSLPSWCCESMIKPFIDVGYDVKFYPVELSENGIIQKYRYDTDILLIIDYFGYTAKIPDLNEYKGVVIRDITHSLFSNAYTDADYFFGSLRKWCGVWTGGFAWTKDKHRLKTGVFYNGEYIYLRSQAMEMKRKYIEGENKDKSYLKVFSDAEECLNCVGVFSASDRDIEMAQRLDASIIKKKRRENAEVLRTAFHDWLIFPQLADKDVPLFVPVFVPKCKRNELRKYLIEHDIYCPVHWPVSEYHRLNDGELFIYHNELSLVCDQRYTVEDMNKMVTLIMKFMEG